MQPPNHIHNHRLQESRIKRDRIAAARYLNATRETALIRAASPLLIVLDLGKLSKNLLFIIPAFR